MTQQTLTLTALVARVNKQTSPAELYPVSPEELVSFTNDLELVTHLNRFCGDRIAWIELCDDLVEVYLKSE